MINTSAKTFYTYMYNEILKEIEKDKYKNYFISYRYGNIDIFTIEDICQNISIWQANYDNNSTFIMTNYNNENAKSFKDEEFKKIFINIIDFNKLSSLENDNGSIKEITLQELIENNVIIDLNKFLDIYIKYIKGYFCIIKCIDINTIIKDLRLKQLLQLYFKLVIDNVNKDEPIEPYIK